MKTKSIIIIIMVLTSTAIQAQINSGGIPLTLNEIHTDIPLQELSFRKDKNVKEDNVKNEASNLPLKIAEAVEVNFTTENSGIWKSMDNGDKIWLLEIKSKGADALNLLFDKYYLPGGARLFVYNKTSREVLGAFTSANNKSYKKLSLAFLKGDKITIEYYEPAHINFKGELSISHIGLAYANKSAGNEKAYGDAFSCHVDINCSQGNNWQTEKRAVARYYFMINGGWYSCSGTLVNNTAQDGTPYFLTANHCLSSAASAQTAIFDFNYESPSCNGSDVSPDRVSGAVLRATYANSDMTLMELTTAPPASFNVYYAGWNRSTNNTANSTNIHHPAGDVKKISIDYHPYSSYSNSINWNGWIITPPHHHWRVLNDVGGIQGGSSGSGMFDQYHRIVGQLTGGSIGCNNVSYFGKLNVSWYGGGTNATRLINWLDPINLGGVTLNGMFPNTCPTNLNITSAYNSGSNIDLEASNTITASNTILSGATVDYDAGIQIDLLNGFHARYGCDFDAFIDGCGGLYRTDNDEPTPDYQSEILKTATTTFDTGEVGLRNYPNPFTGTTTIEYTLPNTGKASLTISDVSGKTVANPIQNKTHQAGTYTLQLDATTLPPGIYIASLQTPKTRRIRKMTVFE